MLSAAHVDRRIASSVAAAMAASPVVAITGARTAGKSTLAREITAHSGGSFVDLDDPQVRTLAHTDPVSFVRGRPEPVVIDEFQRVPDLLAAIKAELNVDRRPGRFVLAGSARHEAVPELADYLTGRVELLRLWPFALAEIEPGARSIVDRLFDGEVPARPWTNQIRGDLVELVLRGGYPIAVGLDPAPRARWFDNLATLVVERITDDVRTVRDIDGLRRFLRLTAAATAQTRNAAEIGRELGIGRDLAGTYLRLLELVYLTVELPAWSTNISARVTKRPKIHLVDSGLAAHLQGLVAARLAPSDPTGASLFGALLETFVATEVVKQLGWSTVAARAYHFRTAEGVEVDLVLEAPDGRIVGIEVKGSAGITAAASRGLSYLRDRLGDRFVAGLVLNTGTDAQRIGDRLAVAPISSLWS